MPRQARKFIKSAFLHIIVQGINREFIFKEDDLKDAYKYILKKNLSQSKVTVLAYCIMDNHAHLLLYSENINEITKLMQKTNTSYAKMYNKTKNRIGYVFRDRYYTQMILTEEQLCNCISYIHNNPIKAGIVNNKLEYKLSSYNEYLSNKEIITQKSIELVFGSSKNYMEQFKEIHKKEDVEDIMDIIDEIKESKKIIEIYEKECNKKLEEIIKDEKLFCELLLQLRHYSGLSLREMSKIFNIGKDKLNRIINSNL